MGKEKGRNVWPKIWTSSGTHKTTIRKPYLLMDSVIFIFRWDISKMTMLTELEPPNSQNDLLYEIF